MPSNRLTMGRAPPLLRLAAVCACVFALAYICLVVPRGLDRVAPVWVANAFGLALLLLSRRSNWGAILAAFALGAFLANLAAGDQVPVAAALAASNTLETGLGALAVLRLLGRRPDMTRLASHARYAFIVGGASLLSAAAASLSLRLLAGVEPSSSFVVWALADFAGLLVLTPCFLVLATERSAWRGLASTAGWPLALLLVVAVAVFSQDRYPVTYLVAACLLLVTWRLHLPGAAAGLLGTLVIAVVCTVADTGPFAFIEGSLTERVLALQAFLAVCYYISLPVAAARDRATRLESSRLSALAEAQDEARKVRMAQTVAHLGYWRFDVRTNEVNWSDELYRICGIAPDQRPSLELAAGLIHPDDRDHCRAQFDEALLAGKPYEQDLYRIETPAGELRYVSGRTVVEHDESGAVTAVFGIMLDKTEFVRSQQAKQEAEDRYRLIAEHAHDIIVRADLQGRIVYASPSCRALGYTPEEMIGMSGPELLHPDDVVRFHENTAALMHGGAVKEVRDRQHRYRRKDGSYVWFEGNPTILADREGRPAELLNVFRDVTARRETEDALAESEARYRALAENVSDVLVRFSPEGVIRYMSASGRRLGIDPDAAVGRSFADYIAPEHVERSQAIAGEILGGGDAEQAGRRLHRLRTADEREVWLEGSPSLVHDADGRVIEVVSVIRDVTERLRMEAALAESEAKFRLFAENATDLVMQTSPDGRFTYISPSCLPLTGYSPEEVLGRTALDWVHPDDASELIRVYQAQVKGAGTVPPEGVEFRLRTKDGRDIWLEARPKATLDPATGQVASVTDVARDITLRKELESQLLAAKAEAEAAAQVKTEFLANMSHELRTPLTSVLGFTKLAIEQPELEPLTRTYVERVSDASRALLSAVNDILDFSKLEAGQITFRPEPVRPAQLVRSALDLFHPQAGAKDLNLGLESDLPEDLALLLDSDRMRQVLLNLIGNAVKFTETGGVTVSAAFDAAEGVLSVSVRDTGAGISEAQLDRLFKRFSQVDGSLTRTGGTGLGLAICKGIVEAMGGSIGVESQPGVGSAFAFRVPATRVEDAGAQDIAPDSGAVTFGGVRVLVADDHPTNRELVSLILAGVGAEVTEAEDGRAAADLAALWPYDVILMDMRMPNLDGEGALRRIRSETGPNDATPILAFTADADTDTCARLMRAGFQGVVSKPVSPDDLVSAVAQATSFAAEEKITHAG